MRRRKADEILRKMEEIELFARSEYTYVEYVNELKKFEKFAAKLVCGTTDDDYIRMNEIVSVFESRVRAHQLFFRQEVRDGLKGIRILNKEISVAMAGKKGEDRVAQCMQWVTREDKELFRNVYLSDGTEETELDDLVLTKNGFIILEVKNAKEDITISEEGRILFNNSSCYHDTCIGEKMDRKRRLLRKRIENELENRHVDLPISIESLIVFSTSPQQKIYVHDLYRKENYCFRGGLYKRIDEFESSITYTDEDLSTLKEIVSGIETEQKRFEIKINANSIKQNFAKAIELLDEVEISETVNDEKRQEKAVVIDEEPISVRNTTKKKKISKNWVEYPLLIAGAGAASVAVVGVLGLLGTGLLKGVEK